MRKFRWMVWILLAPAVAMSAHGQAVRIGISGGVSQKLMVAIPGFAVAPGMEALGTELKQALEYDLMFTGLFTIVPPQNYPVGFRGWPPDVNQIDLAMWKETKTDYLVYANLYFQGDNIVAECRMFDLTTGTQGIGQRLATQRDLPRLVIHRFSEEIVRCVDGVPGIASSRICFSAKTGKGTKEIFAADYDGRNVRQITKFNSVTIKPKVSPDGRKVAYLSYKERYPFLYVLDVSTGNTITLSRNVGLNAAPAWSPDGRTLALVLSKDGNTEIYLKNADGSGERRLTRSKGSDTSPTFAPSGKQIAFVSDREGQPQIFVMGIDGSNVRRLSYQGGRSYDPAWSPDGKMIAYVAERPGEGLQIYVMGADGSNPTPLTYQGGGNESPSWSADSRHVMFCSGRTGKSELWATTVQPPYEQHRISVNDMACEGPSWGPRRQ